MVTPSTARTVVSLLTLLVLFSSGASHGSEAVAVHPGESEPEWLLNAGEDLDEGIDSYFDAAFDDALMSLRSAVKALVTGHDEFPVDQDTLIKSVIFLILTLHALDRDDEAADFAAGLAEVSPPPWGEALDLSPGAREFLDRLQGEVELPEEGNLEVLSPDDGCHVEIDGRVCEHDGSGSFSVFAGVHWVRISCNGLFSEYFKAVVLPGETTALDPGPLDLAGVDVEDDTPPASDLLLEHPPVKKKPWYGDGLNLALQGAGVVLLGVGAGLLAGSMKAAKKARTTTSLDYVGLQDRSLKMQISGWSLLGAGALGFVIGVVRMAIMGGEEG